MKFGLVFTRNISLVTWERTGTLARELKPYSELARAFETIYLFTYGTRASDARFRASLPGNVHILYRPWWVPGLLYTVLMPLIHSRAFREIDIVKTNQMDGSWAGVIAKRIFGTKLVVRCGYEWLDFLIRGRRSMMKRWIAASVERVSYRAADAIIITSESDKRFIAERFGVVPEKITVISNYIDTDMFAPQPIPKEPGRVLFVGRLSPEKNLPMLVEALAGLPLRLVVAGSGRLRSAIEALARDRGVAVEFLGVVPQNELPLVYAASELFVLPSAHEGNPKALLEAMATGLPCIGTDVKGIRDIIEDGVDGMLAEPNAAGLRTALRSLLENPELRARLGASARIKIIRSYGLPVILEKEFEIYKGL